MHRRQERQDALQHTEQERQQPAAEEQQTEQCLSIRSGKAMQGGKPDQQVAGSMIQAARMSKGEPRRLRMPVLRTRCISRDAARGAKADQRRECEQHSAVRQRTEGAERNAGQRESERNKRRSLAGAAASANIGTRTWLKPSTSSPMKPKPPKIICARRCRDDRERSRTRSRRQAQVRDRRPGPGPPVRPNLGGYDGKAAGSPQIVGKESGEQEQSDGCRGRRNQDGHLCHEHAGDHRGYSGHGKPEHELDWPHGNKCAAGCDGQQLHRSADR